jgi:hypothetical protein
MLDLEPGSTFAWDDEFVGLLQNFTVPFASGAGSGFEPAISGPDVPTEGL